MIDIRIIRDNPEFIQKNYLKRRQPELVRKVDEVIDADKKWRLELKKVEELNAKRNKESLEVAKLKGTEKEKKIAEVRELKEKIEKQQNKVSKLEEETKKLLMRLPNLIHDSVPYGKDDTENVEIRKWGKKKDNYKPKSHVDIIEEYDLVDLENAGKISGARFYYLKSALTKLDYALMNYAMDQLMNKGFTLIEPPEMMNKTAYEGVTDLADFEDVMYKIDGEDLYLIATSEHPLVAMHKDKTFYTEKLPIKYCGISSCFRKEAGAHGKDMKGIFRVHRFHKVEQVVFCKPEDSWKIHEELVKNSEELIQGLEIPYHVVNICTGDLGIVAAKKYDIEGWFSAQNTYRELVSGSNCTDYQARRLNIKYLNEKGEKEHVHTLNCTGLATSRIMVAILENNQEKDGTIKIPKILHPYMNGITEIKPIKK